MARGSLGGWLHRMPRGLGKIALSLAIITLAFGVNQTIAPYLNLQIPNNNNEILLANFTSNTGVIKINETDNITAVKVVFYLNVSGQKVSESYIILIEGNYDKLINGTQTSNGQYRATILGNPFVVGNSSGGVQSHDVAITQKIITIISDDGQSYYQFAPQNHSANYDNYIYTEIYKLDNLNNQSTAVIPIGTLTTIIIAFAGLFMLKNGLEEALAIKV